MASAVSPPSSAKRFCPTKRECRKCSNSSAAIRLRSVRTRVSAGQRPLVGFRLHALLQPALLLRHLDVHVLAADLAAVGLAQRLQDFAQRGHRLGAALAGVLAQLPVRNSRSRSQMVSP